MRRFGRAARWAAILASPCAPGMGQEKLVDRFWVTNEGVLVHHGMEAWTHEVFALRWLKEKARFRSSGNRNRDLLRAERVLLERGWLRGQCYLGGLGIQGKPAAVRAHGHVALVLVPAPRRVYVMDLSGETVMYLPEKSPNMRLARCRKEKDPRGQGPGGN